MIGYDIPEIREAVERQLATGIVHTSTLYLIRQQVELAEKIAQRSGIPDARVFFTNSGTEANEAALLVATNPRRSHQILAVRNSYHGRSFAAMGVTGNRTWSASAPQPAPGGAGCTPVTGCVVCWPGSAPTSRSTRRWRTCARCWPPRPLATWPRSSPSRSRAWAVSCTRRTGSSPRWKKVLDEHGILFIADEVQTGWGRTGEHFWGYQAHGVTPDLLTFAKGIGNGFALAGVVGRADVLEGGAGHQLLHLRRQPDLHGGRQRGARLPDRARPPGERGPRRRDPRRRPAVRRGRARLRRRGTRKGADARRRVRPAGRQRAGSGADQPGASKPPGTVAC